MANSIWEEIKYTFRKGDDIVAKIIIVNGVVFLLVNLLRLVFFFNYGRGSPHFDIMLSWLAVPTNLDTLLYRPWTLITSMFLHYNVLHILFNMLIFYWFSAILINFLNKRVVLPIYVMGALTGSFLYILIFNIAPVYSDSVSTAMALGASGGVLAIVIATVTLVPNYTIFLMFLGPVKIKYIGFVVIVLNFIGLMGFNAGGALAHLGGALFGFFFITQLQKGRDWSKGFNKFTEAVVGAFMPRKKIKVAYKKNPKTNEKVKTTKGNDKQKRLDAILDKIAQSGYDSLTTEDKDFLFKVSKED